MNARAFRRNGSVIKLMKSIVIDKISIIFRKKNDRNIYYIYYYNKPDTGTN